MVGHTVQYVFSFPVALNNYIKVGPLVFLLYMFVFTENIMKRPVYVKHYKRVILSSCVATVKFL
jgi:hypothetical protein